MIYENLFNFGSLIFGELHDNYIDYITLLIWPDLNDISLGGEDPNSGKRIETIEKLFYMKEYKLLSLLLKLGVRADIGLPLENVFLEILIQAKLSMVSSTTNLGLNTNTNLNLNINNEQVDNSIFIKRNITNFLTFLFNRIFKCRKLSTIKILKEIRYKLLSEEGLFKLHLDNLKINKIILNDPKEGLCSNWKNNQNKLKEKNFSLLYQSDENLQNLKINKLLLIDDLINLKG